MKNLNIINHPVVEHKLNTMRKKETSSEDFRRLAREVSQLLAFEVTKSIPVKERMIETPVSPMKASFIEKDSLAIVSILRAGNGIPIIGWKLLPKQNFGGKKHTPPQSISTAKHSLAAKARLAIRSGMKLE